MRQQEKIGAGTALSNSARPCAGITRERATPTTTELRRELRHVFDGEASLDELLLETFDRVVAFAKLGLEPLALCEMLLLHQLVARRALEALDLLAGV